MIFLLNLLSGWTLLGWIAALIWACVDIKKSSPQVIVQHISQIAISVLLGQECASMRRITSRLQHRDPTPHRRVGGRRWPSTQP